MEDFLSRHSELFRTLTEFPEGTSVAEILERSNSSSEQLVVLMELEHENEDIYNYAFGDRGALYKSLNGQNISELLRIAEFLCLSAEIIRKLKIQLGAPETLKMLIPEDISVNFEDPKFWIAIDHVEGFKKTFSNGEVNFYCPLAAGNGSLSCLQWAHEKGCPWDSCTCAQAARYGNLECLQYAHKNGCRYMDSWQICAYSAFNGRLDILRWAHENGCPWHENTCSWAAQEGQLECLKYAHQHGCPWNEFTCFWSAGYGYFECLMWARQQGTSLSIGMSSMGTRKRLPVEQRKVPRLGL